MYFRDSEQESTSRQDSIQEPDEKLGTCEMTVKALRNIIAYCILPPKGRLIIYRPLVKSVYQKNQIPYFSIKTYVVCTQKNGCKETVLFSTQNIC